MHVDPFVPQLLIDYDHFCRRFGPLSFGDFVALWHAADAMMAAALDAGFDPHEVPDLLITPEPSLIASMRSRVETERPQG